MSNKKGQQVLVFGTFYKRLQDLGSQERTIAEGQEEGKATYLSHRLYHGVYAKGLLLSPYPQLRLQGSLSGLPRAEAGYPVGGPSGRHERRQA